MTVANPEGIFTSILDPILEGVQLERVIVMPRQPIGRIHGVCVANIRQEIWLYPDHGFDWWNHTEGARNLAACILDRYLPARLGETAEWMGRLLPCRQLVADLTIEFADQVLSAVPFWGGIVWRSEIMTWLTPRLAAAGQPVIDLAVKAEVL
jgi:hypothetical protein